MIRRSAKRISRWPLVVGLWSLLLLPGCSAENPLSKQSPWKLEQKASQALKTAVKSISAGLCVYPDRRYLSEKLFWQAQQQAKKIRKQKGPDLSEADYRRIISLYQKVADTCPREALAAQSQFIIANLYASENQFNKMKKVLTDIVNGFSSHKPQIASRAQFALGKFYESKEQWENAAYEYEKVMNHYPLSTLGLNMPMYLIKHHKQLNDSKAVARINKQAIRHYNKLIEEFADTEAAPLVEDYLASLYLMQGDHLVAIKRWEAIALIYPESTQAPKAILAKAQVYAKKLKDRLKAREAYQEFISKFPGHQMTPKIKQEMARLYLEDNQIQQAKDSYQDLLNHYPNNQAIAISAYIGLSGCYRKEANSDRVIEVYRKIKSLYPDSRAALSIPYLIAQYYEELKYNAKADAAYSLAIAEYKTMVEDTGRNPGAKSEAENLLALCYIKKKEVNKALQSLRSLANKHQQNPLYLLDMASLYRNLNAPSKAIRVYQELLDKYSDNKSIANLAQREIKRLEANISQ